MQLITKSIYHSKHEVGQKRIIPRDIFIKLLRMVKQGMFMYKNNFYQQYDGVGMGFPLRSTITNFFLANMENIIPQNNADFHPKLYSRNVDDVF